MRSARAVLVLALGAGVIAACGSGTASPAPAPAPPDHIDPGAATTLRTESESESESESRTEATSPTGPSTGAALQGVSGELILTRQRDLIGRGFINVLTTNESGHALLITDHQLVSDHFAGTPAPARTVSVPDHRQIAIQVPYGIADDCTSPEPVAAALTFDFTTPQDQTPQSARLELTGTDILDGIRARQCAGQALADQTDLSFADVAIVDGMLHATLRVTRTGGESSFTLGHPIGTVLVDVVRDDAGSSELASSDTTVSIPFRFVVNRCDPHALAEVTKRFGLDLELSVDGADPQPVTIDITELQSGLDEIVQECFDAAADG